MQWKRLVIFQESEEIGQKNTHFRDEGKYDVESIDCEEPREVGLRHSVKGHFNVATYTELRT